MVATSIRSIQSNTHRVLVARSQQRGSTRQGSVRRRTRRTGQGGVVVAVWCGVRVLCSTGRWVLAGGQGRCGLRQVPRSELSIFGGAIGVYTSSRVNNPSAVHGPLLSKFG